MEAMLKKLFVLLVSAASLTLAACQGMVGVDTITIPHINNVDANSVPDHTKVAIGALSLRMRGHSEADVATKVNGSENTVFQSEFRIPASRQAGSAPRGWVRQLLAEGGTSTVGTVSLAPGRIPGAEPRFKYQGFEMRQVTLTSYDLLAGEPTGHRVTGQMRFADSAGRHATSGFAIDYRVTQDTIMLERASRQAVFSTFPEMEMFIVPSSALLNASQTVFESFVELHQLAKDTAVSLNDANVEQKKQSYTAVVFIKDRIAPDSKLEVRISSDKSMGSAGYKDDTRYRRYDDGWVIAMVSGKFDLNSAKPFWVKVVFTPGSDGHDHSQRERLIGLFSTAIKTPEPDS